MSKGTRYLLSLVLSLVWLASFGPRPASAQSYVFSGNVFATGQSPEALVSQVCVPTPTTPTCTAAQTDFNKDGIPDVAVANQGAKTVSILLGGTTGAAFKPHVDYAVGANPIAIVAADFNNDGNLDLAVVNSSDNTISVLLGNGDGTFQNQAVNPVGTNPSSIAAADMNGDGKIDLVVSNFNDNTVTVLLGKGDGTFTPATGSPFLTGTGPKSLTIQDFNKDEKLDVATADDSIDDVSILFGNGDGTLQACAVSSTTCTFATGKNPVQIVTADFNLDGQPDLATANSDDNDVSILLNNNGKFPTQTTAPTLYTCTALVAGDFNGDRIPDLAVTTSKSNSVSILLGKGTGQFDPALNFATGGLSPIGVGISDINGDGHPDVVFANSGDNDVSVLLNNGTGTFTSTLTATATFTSPVSLALADFQDDNVGLTSPKIGVATVGYSPTAAGTVSVLLGNGNGTLQTAVNYPNVTGTDPEFIASADLNGDGYPDLIVVNYAGDPVNTSGSISVLLNQGNGTFLSTAAPTYATGAGPTAVAGGDFNGDGKFDLAVANSTSATISILFGNGDGTFQPKVDYSTGAGTNPSWIVAADVNGDGILDLITADELNPIAPGGKSVGSDDVSVLLGVAGGTFQTATLYPLTAGSHPGAVAVADFNGDGMPDIATANLNNTASVLLNIGSGKFGSASSYATGGEGAGIAAGDLAGNGINDVFVGTGASFMNSVSTLLGGGKGTFQTHVDIATGFFQAPNRRQPVALADFNNDGYLDLVASDYNTNFVDIYLNQAEIAFAPGILNFPGQLLGTASMPQTITVSNPGTTPLSFTSFVPSGDFTQTDTCSASLAVGANCSASVTFTPSAGGTRSGSLTVTDNVPGSPQVLALSGTGEAPAVTLAPTSLTFGGTSIGSTSAAQTVTLTNSGTGTLTITSIAASAQFAETNTCSSVAVGANCTISVTFTPTASGTQSGTLTITDNATPSPQTAALTGTGNGPAVVLMPPTVTFSSQPVGSTSPVQKVTLTNGGNQSLSITKISSSGPFAETNSCGTTLAANASCTISVDFVPTVSGPASGSLTVTDNATGSPQTLALSGTGTTGGYAQLTPAGGLTFPTTPLGSSAPAQKVTLQNTGNATLSITKIAVTGANLGDFSETTVSPNCGGSLAPGASCIITVNFKPAAAGNRSAALTVTSNGVGSPQSVALAGTGSSAPIVTLAPASLDFGSDLIGSKTVKTVMLTNSGNATLTISSITTSGNSSFSEVNNCTSVAAGSPPCIITVTFDPSTSASVTGSVVITDNANPNTQTVALSGSGNGPALTLAPTMLSFPGQPVKSTSAAQTMTLTNGGTSALSITSVAMTGTAASQFAETNTCGTSVAVGASCTISVTFSPTSDGTQSAFLTITDNAANNPQSFALSGGGADFAIAAATSSQTVSAGQSGIFSLSLKPTGGFNQNVSLACSASIPAGTCSISQSSLTLNSPITVTVTATTTAGAATLPAPRLPSGRGPWLWLVVLGVAGLGASLLRRERRISWALALALAAVSVWGACGGGSSSSSMTPTSTPSGTYSLTVTATSGTLSNNTSLTLVVH